MHVTRTERPARAEALARAGPIRRLHPITVLVVAMLGAAMLFSADRFFWSSVQPRPLIEPISRTVVTPCASQSL